MLWAMARAWILGVALTIVACESTPVEPQSPSSKPVVGPAVVEPTTMASGERAFLAAHPKPREILDEARTEAKNCDAGDAQQCRALANRYEEGIGAPRTRDRAIALYRRGCGQGLGHHCLLGGWLLTATRDDAELASGIDLLGQACELDQLQGCVAAATALSREEPAPTAKIAELRAKACRGGYAIACEDGVTMTTVANAAMPSAEAACPVSFYQTMSQGGGPRLHGTDAQLDHEAMLATIPAEAPEFTTERRSSTPAGQAGTRTSVATAEFVRGASRVSLAIIDRAPDCTLQPGTGAAMMASVVAERGGRSVAVATNADELPAVVVGPIAGSEGLPDTLGLTVWVGDRCSVSWTGSGVTEAELLTLAGHLNWMGLTELCKQRPGG
jgi:hypothetical protein